MGIFKKIFDSIGGNYEPPKKGSRGSKPAHPQDSMTRQTFTDRGPTRKVAGRDSAFERTFERPTGPNTAGAMTSVTDMSSHETDRAPFPPNMLQTFKQPESAQTDSSALATSLVGLPVTDNTLLDEVVHAFDEAFDAVISSEVATGPVTAAVVQPDEGAVQDLFVQMAANHARPLKHFIFELRRGTATRDWIEICRPALRSISRAAENMDLFQVAQRMNDFDETLSLAQISSERLIGGEIRQCILAGYEALIETLPEAFRIGEEARQREEFIIKSLLKQIPGLGRVTFEKLYGAGLGSMDMLFLANKEDLAAATTISLGMCERICDRVQQYRKEVEDMPLDTTRSGYRFRLTSLVSELRRQERELGCSASEMGSHPTVAAEKRQRRQNRQRCLLQIMVMLAELGELDLIHKVQRLSFKRRIQKLDEYLTSSAA